MNHITARRTDCCRFYPELEVLPVLEVGGLHHVVSLSDYLQKQLGAVVHNFSHEARGSLVFPLEV